MTPEQKTLFEEYHVWAAKIASKWTFVRHLRYHDRQECYQAAQLGLLAAIRNYEPDRGIPFKLFAVQRIVGAMADHARRWDWASRLMRKTNEARKGPHSYGVDLEGKEFQYPDKRKNWEKEHFELRDSIALILKQIPDKRSQRIVIQYYLRDLTMAVVAKLNGIVESRVLQIVQCAVDEVRVRNGLPRLHPQVSNRDGWLAQHGRTRPRGGTSDASRHAAGGKQGRVARGTTRGRRGDPK